MLEEREASEVDGDGIGAAFYTVPAAPPSAVTLCAGCNFPVDSLIEDIPANGTGTSGSPQLSAFMLWFRPRPPPPESPLRSSDEGSKGFQARQASLRAEDLTQRLGTGAVEGSTNGLRSSRGAAHPNKCCSPALPVPALLSTECAARLCRDFPLPVLFLRDDLSVCLARTVPHQLANTG